MGLGKASQVLLTASLLPAARGAVGDACGAARGAAGNVREASGDTCGAPGLCTEQRDHVLPSAEPGNCRCSNNSMLSEMGFGTRIPPF